MLIADREEQNLKAASPMLVTLLGIVIEAILRQSQKVPLLMLVMPSGILTDTISQLEKAYSPICVTLLGIFTEFKAQPEKAPSSMRVTLLPIVIDDKEKQL